MARPEAAEAVVAEAAVAAVAAGGTRVPSAAEGKRRVDFGAPVPPSNGEGRKNKERQCGCGGAEVGLRWGDVCAGWPHIPPRLWYVSEDTGAQPPRVVKLG